MKYLILLLALLPGRLFAQSKLSGLGNFVIGVTTPDSLQSQRFTEQELVVLKGTVASPCPHIRIFTADSLEVEGLQILNLSLVFYEDELFRITCDYSEPLEQVFVGQYGKGTPQSAKSLTLCEQDCQKRMLIEGQRWRNGDIVAVAIWAEGYNAMCEQEQAVRLTIVSQPLMALSSECDLEDLDPYFDSSWRTP